MKTDIINQPPKKYKIGLDCRLCGHKHAGLGRYIQNLALYLPFILPTNYKLVYFFYDKDQWQATIQAISNFQPPNNLKLKDLTEKIKPKYIPIKHYSLAEQTQLPKIFQQEKLDLIHVPHFNLPYFTKEKKIILTIHDLLWHEKKGLHMTTLPPWQYYFKYYAYRLLSNKVIHRANKIIVPSHTIEQTLLNFYPAVKDKITVIYNGVNKFKHIDAHHQFNQLIPENFLLYVGSLYPHKNINLVLQALQKNPQLNLVIVSARDAFWLQTLQQIKKLAISQQVTFLGPVTDRQLKSLYQRAAALIQPSLSEGFGLTGVEALECGTKLIASAIPIFQEVYGDAFIPFNPHSVTDFLLACQKAQTIDLNQYRKIAYKQAEKYNWLKTSQQVCQLYQETINHP